MSERKLTDRQKQLADSIYEACAQEPRVLSNLVDDFVENLSEADFAGEWEKFCGDEPMPKEVYMADRFMKLGKAFDIVLELAQQNIADQLDHPDHYAEQQLAVDIVTDWATNNLYEDD